MERFKPARRRALAANLAGHAAQLREAIRHGVARARTGRDLIRDARDILGQDFGGDEFADAAAHIGVCGLLAAHQIASAPATSGAPHSASVAALRRDVHPRAEETRHRLRDLPVTDPWLRRLFADFADGKPGLGAALLDETSRMLLAEAPAGVARDEAGTDGMADPFSGIYEVFLDRYNPGARKHRGVYFTPMPVVSFILRSVDEIARHELGLPGGLLGVAEGGPEGEAGAAHEGDRPAGVRIVDPAVGTGNFWIGLIDLALERFRESWKRSPSTGGDRNGAWREYVGRNLLARVQGFEIMPGPWGVAHLRLGLKLRSAGFEVAASDRLRLHLADALEPSGHGAAPRSFASGGGPGSFTFVVGNPPYAGISANRGPWITSLIDEYKRPVRGEETQIRTLSDDYVKFFRLAQFLVEQTGQGAVGLITNSGYFDGVLFRGFREALLTAYDRIWLYDVHGQGRRGVAGDRDENIFSVRVGAAVFLGVRKPRLPAGAKGAGPAAEVYSAGAKGTRASKLAALSRSSWRSVDWGPVRTAPALWHSRPRDQAAEEEYMRFPSLLDWWGTGDEKRDRHARYGSGFKTQQDAFAIAPDPDVMKARIEFLLAPATTERVLRSRFRMCGSAQWSFDAARDVLGCTDWRTLIRPVLYRPFDVRWTCYSRHVVSNPRLRVMRHMFRPNLALATCRQVAGETWSHLIVTRLPADMSCLSSASRECSHVFPLYLYEAAGAADAASARAASARAASARLEGSAGPATGASASRRANLNDSLMSALADRLGMTWLPDGLGGLRAPSLSWFEPEDVLDYLVAVAHAAAFRDRYCEFLRTAFPRFPLPPSAALWNDLAAVGARLTGLYADGPPPGGGAAHAAQPGPAGSALWIGGHRILAGHDADSREHARSATGILACQREVDAVIDRHGGWGIFA